jgi:hypothetical protein
MTTKKTLPSLYSFPGFQAQSELKEIATDPEARIITLKRLQKKRNARTVENVRARFMIPKSNAFGICPRVGQESFLSSSSVGFSARAATQ